MPPRPSLQSRPWVQHLSSLRSSGMALCFSGKCRTEGPGPLRSVTGCCWGMRLRGSGPCRTPPACFGPRAGDHDGVGDPSLHGGAAGPRARIAAERGSASSKGGRIWGEEQYSRHGGSCQMFSLGLAAAGTGLVSIKHGRANRSLS